MVQKVKGESLELLEMKKGGRAPTYLPTHNATTPLQQTHLQTRN